MLTNRTRSITDWTGYLYIEASEKNGRTILNEQEHFQSYKVTHPLYLAQTNEATVYILSVGGGYVQGDRYYTKLIVNEDSSLSIKTQGSTKVYRTENEPVYQKNEYFIKSDATLKILPEPLILYKDAIFHQETFVTLEHNSCFILSEIITPGYDPTGLPFAYHAFYSDLKIMKENQVLVFDRLKLVPNSKMASIGYMEGYSHFGTLYIIDSYSLKAEADIRSYCNHMKNHRIGISQLPNGIGLCIRILSHSSYEIEDIFQQILSIFQKEKS